MTTAVRNVGASVTARLLNIARETGDDYQRLLTSYCFERFLYRVGVSSVGDRFVLKGAMLLRTWADQPYRATTDLDLLRRGESDTDAIRRDLAAVCNVSVAADGVTFEAAAAEIEPVRTEDEYAGMRVILPASLGTARLRLQIDLGVGDAVWPAPRTTGYPALLDFPAPSVLAYPPEAVVAEKLEAIVVLGMRNSRIKDFFDLEYMARHFTFDRATLAEAVRRTFERRGTPIPTEDPVSLTTDYWTDPIRPSQLRAFARRAGLEVSSEYAVPLALLRFFLLPVLKAARGTNLRAIWRPGGPWEAH